MKTIRWLFPLLSAGGAHSHSHSHSYSHSYGHSYSHSYSYSYSYTYNSSISSANSCNAKSASDWYARWERQPTLSPRRS